ncbi:hypothetical protein [Rufibacter latericius]|uniref:HEPN AbiU2-like domain-containing protein n=1 Tax=Rufibacter latericius TaxID=2487040 RepID=A0A3M9ML80_9BACT|nr:hypothetical protein [Rufibacter latericius]RNI25955.1 hypothetical protein EFB08_14055 [Rufibacter latericius]
MNGLEKLLDQCEKNIDFYTKHLDSLRRNIALQEEAKRLLNTINPEQDYVDFKEMEQFNNYNGYITISTLDLSVNLMNLVKAKTDWEKIFFIKYSYLIIYETIDKLKPLKGKSGIQTIVESNYPDLEGSLKSLFQDIDAFKKATDYKKIENTRNYTAGHIEKSLKKYYDTAYKLDGEEAASFINQFLIILNKALFITRDYAVIANKNQKEKSRDTNVRLNNLLDEIQSFIRK